MPTRKPSSSKTNSRASVEPRLSRLRRPGDLPVDEWQIKLRRQFGLEQAFLLESLGEEPVFCARWTNASSTAGVRTRTMRPSLAPCWAWLTEHQCDMVQGYLLSGPLQPEVFEDLIARSKHHV